MNRCHLMSTMVSMFNNMPQYDAEALVPFWTTDTMHRESILFVKDNDDETASGELLFPPRKTSTVLSAQCNQQVFQFSTNWE